MSLIIFIIYFYFQFLMISKKEKRILQRLTKKDSRNDELDLFASILNVDPRSARLPEKESMSPTVKK